MLIPLRILFFFLITLQLSPSIAASSFTYNSTSFLLNGQPFQILSGEMHYPRIPREYWRHRIQMAKSLGLNTISSYIFWNLHQRHERESSIDLESLHEFISIVHEEGMYMLIRPGPYVCGEWDAGGLPSWLLKNPMKIRCSDAGYLQKVDRYLVQVAKVLKDLQISRGGPILMLQIENEYGSFGTDHEYLSHLALLWRSQGIEVPFYTADGAWVAPWSTALSAGSPDFAVLGIDPGVTDDSWQAAMELSHSRNRPIFSAETYPGWMTHWGESFQGKSTASVLAELEYLLKREKSFNFYMIHGGTNFAFTAGANFDENNGFQPQITSYDYDAPINEQGAATAKYQEIKRLFELYRPANASLGLQTPESLPIITFEDVKLSVFASLWDNLPIKHEDPMPRPMEFYDQYSGIIVYRHKLSKKRGPVSGTLDIREVHDIGLVYLDGELVGKIDRTARNSARTVEIKERTGDPLLEILVFAMGRVNFGPFMLDHKGITDFVTLQGLELMQWEAFPLELEGDYLERLQRVGNETDLKKGGLFFRGFVNVSQVGDTYIDVSQYKIGVLWVNRHNLGRLWSSKGPQMRLFCPGSYLKKGVNEILVLDLVELEEKSVKGVGTLF